jgi:multidrug efflux pump subunit AcrB
LRALLSYFIKYPITGNLLLVLILIFGYFGLTSLRTTFFPEAESRIINIQAIFPGASPEEIEEGIILKIEDNLDGLSGIERITSISKENTGTITVEVNKNYDTEIILQDVKNAVDRINSFPDGMEPPGVYIRENESFAISFALSGDIDLFQLKTIAQQVELDLRSMDGLSKVKIEGYADEEIEIELDEEKMKALHISFDEIALAVRNHNVDITGGTIKTSKENLLIRALNKKFDAQSFENIVIRASNNGSILFLKDIANIHNIWADIPSNRFFSGKPAVVITVNNTIHEDIIHITKNVRNYIDEFNAKNEVVHADIIRDGSTVVQDRINLLVNNGIVGFFLVLFFLSLFLHPRMAAWVAIGIPVSFAGMFIVAAFYGISLNVISLFGMIIVIGILVDDGIVISENIYQHYERGKTPIQAAIDGTLEVLPAITSAILTTVIAFSTFFFLDGRMGEFFPDMGFVVIVTLLFSLVEGIFILPAHIGHSKALSNDIVDKKSWMNKLSDYFAMVMLAIRKKLYEPVLHLALKKPFIMVAITIGMMIISIAGLQSGKVKVTVFPYIENDFINVTLKMPAGFNENQTENVLSFIEKCAWEVNDSLINTASDKKVIVNIEKKFGPQANEGMLNIILLTSEKRSLLNFEIINALSDKVGKIHDVDQLSYTVSSPFGKAVSLALYSNDLTELDAASEMLIEAMEKTEKLKSISSSDQKGQKEIIVELNDKAKALGLTVQQVVGQIRKGFFGLEIQRLQRGIDEVKVWIRYKTDNRNSIGDLENMQLLIGNKSYLMKDLVTFNTVRGKIGIEHIDGRRSLKIDADLKNPKVDSPNGVIADLEEGALKIIMATYPNVKYSVEGQIREQAKTGKSLKFSGPIILILIISCVVYTFRSVFQTVALFSIIPFGFVGLVWGHFFHDKQISMFSWFGAIALIGVMINDALVFVSAYNTNMKNGLSFKDALLDAGKSRFRPIILTTLTTVAGLMPLIFERSFQAQFLIPMAISIAYGMIVATFLTLVYLPSMLVILNYVRRIIRWLFTGIWPTPEEVETPVKELKHEKMMEENS